MSKNHAGLPVLQQAALAGHIAKVKDAQHDLQGALYQLFNEELIPLHTKAGQRIIRALNQRNDCLIDLNQYCVERGLNVCQGCGRMTS